MTKVQLKRIASGKGSNIINVMKMKKDVNASPETLMLSYLLPVHESSTRTLPENKAADV